MKRSMNQIYRLIWSHVINGWVAVSETSRGRGKVSGSKLVAAALALSTALMAHAGPTNGQVTAGTGSISQVGLTTTIRQSSSTLSLDWKSFNVGSQETVNFVQPSAGAIAVNRIFDINGTKILGNLNANGQVYLVNPNGVLFGQGAQVNVGGLVASTLDLNDASLIGNVRSFGGNGIGSIVNQGTIKAESGGYIALLGNTVVNHGTLTAHKGSVAIGAGNAATLTFQNNSLVSMQIDQSVLNSMVENSGLIRADGGVVIMTAGARDSLLASVVNNTGVIQAQTVDNQSGSITLLGGMAAGAVNVGGTLDASAPYGGNGGFIETSGLRLTFTSDIKITTASATGKTGNWLIDPVDFTIAATGGDISGLALGGLLGSNSITIQTTAAGADATHLAGATGSKGDINVNDTVSWASNTLTLKAENNININAKLSGSGTAKLALEYGQATVAASNKSDYIVKAAVDLAAGQNFSTKLGNDGVVKNYTVITSLGAAGSTTGTDLQGMMGSAANLAKNYALGSNIDATATSGWNGGLGFTSVGTTGTPFMGSLDGLGHTITGLTIKPAAATPDVGLIGAAGAGTMIANVGLIGGVVVGGAGTGGLVGSNASGSINNSYNTGSVTGGAGTGGLVGSDVSGLISNSYATGKVVGGAGTGGLLGGNTVGSISNSYATGDVDGAAGTGGLIGAMTTGSVSNSYATGKVTGAAGTGGMLGEITTGNISNSYATGAVQGAARTGGLLGGGTSGNITDSYATGNVVGLASAGGLVSTITTGVISNSYATGNVNGDASSAGLVGTTTGAVTSSYATGNVVGAASAGGLVGTTTASIENSYATGNVTGAASSGQLVGTSTGTIIKNSFASGSSTGATVGGLVGSSTTTPISGDTGNYWDITAAPTLTSIRGAAKTTAEMKAKATFSGWDTTIWTLQDGTLPILTALIKTVTVTATANNVFKAYDGLVYSGPYTVTYSDPTKANLFSGLTFSGASQSAINVGNYAITAGGLSSSNAQYIVVYVDGLLTITKAHLTVTANDTNRTYGSANPALTAKVSGFVNGETASVVSGSGSASTTANALTGAGTAVITAGVGNLAAANYDFTVLNPGTLTIEKAHLTVTANDQNRAYGVANPTLTTTVSGFVNGETASVLSGAGSALTAASTSSNVGNYAITAGYGNLTASNYDFTSLINGTLTISSASLSVLGMTGTRAYDGTNIVGANIFNLIGLANGDTLTLSGAGTVADKNVGNGKTVTLGSLLLGNGTGLASNYTFTGGTQIANITPRALTVSALGVAKIYDGLSAAAVTLGDNRILSDVLSINSSASFIDKNAGAGKTINVSGISLSGADAANYTVNAAATTTADITARALNATALGVSKIYDGLTTGAATMTDNRISNDVLTVNSTVEFLNKNVGVGKSVNVTGIHLTGADALNYTVNTTASSTADILARALTVSATSSNKTYDGLTNAVVTLGDNRVAGDVLTVTNTGANFFDKNAGSGKFVSVSGISASGADAANYTVSTTASTSADIAKRALTVTASSLGKTYDGSVAATVALGDNRVVNDLLGINSSASYADKNAGVGKTISVSGINLSGADAGNYTVNATTSTRADIAARALAVTATGANKVYDALTTAAVAFGDNRIASDVLTINGAANFSDKHAAIGKAISVSGINLSGADAGNYTVNTTASTLADIATRALNVTASGTNKIYDGLTAATVTLGDNRIASDILTVNGTASFSDKNAALGKTIGVSGINLSGADAGNYTVNATASTL